MISMLLPGTVVTYYGQEIAMLNGLVAKDQMRDLLGGGGRDPNRLPMQWDDSINAGEIIAILCKLIIYLTQ